MLSCFIVGVLDLTQFTPRSDRGLVQRFHKSHLLLSPSTMFILTRMHWMTTLASPKLVTVLAGLVFTTIIWPGVVQPDSEIMIGQAREGITGDWHSPGLIHVWRLLLRLVDSPALLLLMQSMPYWAGFALLAWTLERVGRRRAAWAITVISLFPLYLFYNRYVLKDVALYSMLVFASGLLASHLAEGGRRPTGFRLALGVAALVFASFIRVNAAFAVGALLAGLLMWQRRPGIGPAALLSLPLAATVLGGVLAVNTQLLTTKREDPMQSLQFFDLLGIHRFSADSGVWGRYDIQASDTEACYTSFYWDTLLPRGICYHLRARLRVDSDIDYRNQLWRQAIISHPLAYAEHRLRHLNSQLYFAVPALHLRFNKGVRDGSTLYNKPLKPADVRLDYIKRNVLFWPATWLAVAIAALAMTWRPHATDWASRLASLLLLSGITYSLAYAIIGVATEIRYHIWMMMATMIALVLASEELLDAWRVRPRVARLAVVSVLAVIAVGLGARLLDVPFT